MKISYRKVHYFGLGLLLCVILYLGISPSVIFLELMKSNKKVSLEIHSLSRINDVRANFYQSWEHFSRLAEGKNHDPIMDSMNQVIRTVDDMLKNIQGIYPENVDHLNRIIKNAIQIKTLAFSYSDEFGADPGSDNTHQLEKMAFQVKNQSLKEISDFIEMHLIKDINEQQEGILDKFKRGRTIGTTMLVLGLLISLTATILMLRSLRDPLHKLIKGTQKLAQGDLDFRLDDLSDDEIGKLGSAFNRMAKDLQERDSTLKQEIAERKKKEDELRENEERLSLALDISGASTWEWDLKNDQIVFSDDFYRNLGLTKEEFGTNNQDFENRIHPDDLMRSPEEFKDILKNGKPLFSSSEYRILGKNKEWRWVYARAKIIERDEDGKPLILVGTIMDITDRKGSEEALRKSEEKYRTILEDMEEGYFETDLEGNFVFANRIMTETLGFSPEDIEGVNYREYTDEANAKKLFQVFNGVYFSGQSVNDFEYTIVNRDSEEVLVEISVSLIKDKDGKPFGFRGLARDVTGQKSMEEQLLRAQKMEAIGTLAGGVAHDLNNILSGIVSYPELLLLDLPQDSPLTKPIQTIQKSGEKASAIVQDLLTLARRGVVVRELICFNDIIKEYLNSPEFFKLKSFHPDLKIKTNLDKELLNIMGSPVHLSKTIMNLVSNGAEAMALGGTITISTESRYLDMGTSGYEDVEEGDYVVVKIKDNGTGIASSDMERLFEPFYSKKVMGKSGTGLGMAVVWGTVKDHNGFIDLKSIEGKGSAFTLFFPASREESSSANEELSFKDYLGNGEKILVVDDIEEQREIAAGILGRLGYSVNTVSSGEEAVEYLQGNSADLLVLDMIMNPGMDGLDTYRKILEFHPEQKVILGSGFSETERVREAQKLGAGQYIKKPYSLEKIGRAVKKEVTSGNLMFMTRKGE